MLYDEVGSVLQAPRYVYLQQSQEQRMQSRYTGQIQLDIPHKAQSVADFGQIVTAPLAIDVVYVESAC